MELENLETLRARQNKELQIRNNPLSLYPETLDSLLKTDFPPTRWLVEGLIPTEGVTIMSATPGSFKTWVMLETALSITQDRKLFDRYETQKVGVLIVDEESGARMLNERFKQLKAPHGLPISYFSRAGHRVTQEYIDSLISVCLANDIGLVIFDSLVRLHQGDENTSKDMSELFNMFRLLADNGISVLIAHHNRKGMPGSYNPANDMRGSGDILAAVDCHIALNRINGGDYVEVRQTKNRYMREVKPFKLRFTKQDNYSEFHFVEEIRTKQDDREAITNAVLNQLAKNHLPTKKQLLEELNHNGIDVKLAKLGEILDELVNRKLVDTKPGSRNAVHYFVIEAESGSASKTQ